MRAWRSASATSPCPRVSSPASRAAQAFVGIERSQTADYRLRRLRRPLPLADFIKHRKRSDASRRQLQHVDGQTLGAGEVAARVSPNGLLGDGREMAARLGRAEAREIASRLCGFTQERL